MNKMTKAEFDVSVTAMQATLATIVENRKLKDAKLAVDGAKRSATYCAYFQSAAFAELAVTDDINVHDIMNRCDKTLDRVRVLIGRVLSGNVEPIDHRDQQRYFTNMMRTFLAASAAKVAVSKSDILATGTKVETANEFVTVSSRVMSDLTADRQTKLVIYALSLLGVMVVTKDGNRITDISLDTKSKFYKRIKKAFDAQK